jgi:hypothetical protein
MELILGNLYDIKMIRGGYITSNVKFVEYHDAKNSHETLYTFVTLSGVKIQLTRGLVENSILITNIINKVNYDTINDDDLYS